MSRPLATTVLLGTAVLLAAPAAVARPKARPPQSQPARAAPVEQVYRPPVVHVTGKRQAPIRLVFGRQAPATELRPPARDSSRSLVEAVRRAPF
jgi:hypothetical protein